MFAIKLLTFEKKMSVTVVSGYFKCFERQHINTISYFSSNLKKNISIDSHALLKKHNTIN